jgi:indole-3-glycerol phosphate synthase
VILDEILSHKRREVDDRRSRHPTFDLDGLAPARSFKHALRQPGVGVIAEFKRRSPSGGEIRPGASVVDIAREYQAHGAAALSILTDEKYFGGSDADLVSSREAVALPVLRKDFVIDAYQLYEARAIGADAVLLIVRALSDGAMLVGVNNRDLDTLVTDVSLAPRLRPMVPAECVFVAESGVSSPEQVAMLNEAGVDAVLIGEALMRTPDPGARLAQLVAAGQRGGVRA